MSEITRAIVNRVQSYYWPANADVFILECGHRHVRPNTWEAKIGDPFRCCFCEDDPHSNQWPEARVQV